MHFTTPSQKSLFRLKVPQDGNVQSDKEVHTSMMPSIGTLL